LAKDLVVDELLNIAKNQLDSSVRACRYVLDLGEESRLRLNETNILQLPDLALIEVLKYLPLCDILSLRGVNNRKCCDVNFFANSFQSGHILHLYYHYDTIR